ncbi:hypothetical protein I316_00903 [Kwoniella heveanensis BCC8398]|uniref:Mid2 domain-containing protein n=1 Tax=Kwoniella heveanensis BCC8398 TaxID=1296120 RepID=A0A1B9H3D0_9TREE|nr:hypothetical protein I316_00903 [Kwoniella heveanensis BCC8398]
MANNTPSSTSSAIQSTAPMISPLDSTGTVPTPTVGSSSSWTGLASTASSVLDTLNPWGTSISSPTVTGTDASSSLSVTSTLLNTSLSTLASTTDSSFLSPLSSRDPSNPATSISALNTDPLSTPVAFLQNGSLSATSTIPFSGSTSVTPSLSTSTLSGHEDWTSATELSSDALVSQSTAILSDASPTPSDLFDVASSSHPSSVSQSSTWSNGLDSSPTAPTTMSSSFDPLATLINTLGHLSTTASGPAASTAPSYSSWSSLSEPSSLVADGSPANSSTRAASFNPVSSTVVPSPTPFAFFPTSSSTDSGESSPLVAAETSESLDTSTLSPPVSIPSTTIHFDPFSSFSTQESSQGSIWAPSSFESSSQSYETPNTDTLWSGTASSPSPTTNSPAAETSVDAQSTSESVASPVEISTSSSIDVTPAESSETSTSVIDNTSPSQTSTSEGPATTSPDSSLPPAEESSTTPVDTATPTSEIVALPISTSDSISEPSSGTTTAEPASSTDTTLAQSEPSPVPSNESTDVGPSATVTEDVTSPSSTATADFQTFPPTSASTAEPAITSNATSDEESTTTFEPSQTWTTDSPSSASSSSWSTSWDEPSTSVDPTQPSTSGDSSARPTSSAAPTSDDGFEPSSSTTTEVEPSGTSSGSVSVTSASGSVEPAARPSDDDSSSAANSTSIDLGSTVPGDAMSSLASVSATPSVNGSGVMTFEPTSTSTDWDSAYTASSTDVSSSSWTDEAYTPTQTWLIGATSVATSSETWSEEPTYDETTAPTGTKTTVTTSTPSVATIPSSMPTLIVPANSVANNAEAGTGSETDPIQDDTLIAILLAADYYPWWFVVNSSDATSQLFNTFPTLISGALEIAASQVQTYGLQVYQPAAWDGDEASLLTQYMAYIPTQYFDTLNAYIKTASSPLYSQSGIEGALAAQINTAFPLAASSETAPTSSTTSSGSSSSNRKRNIIIGVCVGIGGALWIGLIFWIYRRVKTNNDKAVHKRLSEHMSMFGDHRPMSEVYAASGWRDDSRRVSMAPSIAASEVDDRPSSFYASPFENDRSMREQQRMERESYGGSYSNHSYGSANSPTGAHYGPSVFGTSWFQNPHQQQQGAPRQRASQNPFEDIATRSYLGTNAGYISQQPHSPVTSTGSGTVTAKRRSAAGKPVSKAIISNPTLQANSLEFRDYGSTS